MIVSSSVFLCFHLVRPPARACATPSEAFSFENADIQTVVKYVSTLTGIPFVFDPEQVKGKITVLAPKSVSAAEVLELLKSALALHGYSRRSRAEGMWIVPAERLAPEAITVKVVRLTYAQAGELAYILSWVAPASVRIAPHFPTNSLIISGPPAVVDELVDIIKSRSEESHRHRRHATIRCELSVRLTATGRTAILDALFGQRIEDRAGGLV
jgi:type II secretory pathway component GspD/PulD (secretin)